jgi:Dpy-30 motif
MLLVNYNNTGVVEPLKTEEEARSFLLRRVNPKLTQALTMLCKVKPQQPLVSSENLILNIH